MRTSEQSKSGRMSSFVRGALREVFAGAVLACGGAMAYVHKDPSWAAHGLTAASIVSASENLYFPERDDAADRAFMLRIAFGMAGICTAIGIEICRVSSQLTSQGLTGSAKYAVIGSLVAVGCLQLVAHMHHDERRVKQDFKPD